MDATSSLLILFGGLLVAAFIHAVNWDSHFLTIIPLKVKHYAGIATAQDYAHMANICEDRKKPECVETSYMKIAALQPANLNNLEKLGKLQFQQKLFNRAAQTFTHYFTIKGKSAESAYLFAQVLQKLKKYSESEKYYRFALSRKSNTLQVSVTRAYVLMLMEANRLTQAKNVLLAYREADSLTLIHLGERAWSFRSI